jgi:hypothetical protein
MLPNMNATFELPPDYESEMANMLATIAVTEGVEPAELTGFWPLVGIDYGRRLLVIGRAVNQWLDRVTLDELRGPGGPERFAAVMRKTTGWRDGDPMGWVTESWGRGGGGYSTARSAFWRMARRVLERVDPESADDPLWSGRLAWSNAVKVAPWAGGNPAGPLLSIQRELGPGLIAQEVASLQPELVLVLTGRWWFEPVADGIGLDVDWRDGLLQGVADDGDRRWLIAPHPQGKPRALFDEIAAAI